MADLSYVQECDQNLDADFNVTFDTSSNSTAELVTTVSVEVYKSASTGTVTGIFFAVVVNTIISIKVRILGLVNKQCKMQSPLHNAFFVHSMTSMEIQC